MIRARRKRNQVDQSPDMTSLIDIVFILLIFFMLTAAPNLSGISTESPEAETASVQDKLQNEITITKDAKLYFNGLSSTLPQLSEHLQKLKKGSPVYIKGDKNISWGLMVQVIDEVRKFPQLGIVFQADMKPKS